MNRRILIIDGNNLAHEVFSLRKNSRVTLEHAQQLADLLCTYLSANPAQRLSIELFFDGYLTPTRACPVSLRVIPTHEADDEIIQRVFECAHKADDVVVVTADENLRAGIAGLGAVTISAFEFILVHNPQAPRFIYPGSLPFDFTRTATAPDPEPLISLTEFTPPPSAEPLKTEAEPLATEAAAPVEEPASVDLPASGPAEASAALPAVEPSAAPEPRPAAPEPPAPVAPTAWYRATPTNWPPDEGARFLVASFYPAHRAAAAALLPTGQVVRPADLEALAALLVTTCGHQANFCQRGSLMDRVRLALLQAQGAWLSMDVLAERVGLNPLGLQGKIKKKAGKWVEIRHEEPAPGEMA